VIKAILFDVGGTLIEVTPSVGDVYSRVAYKYGQHILPAVMNERFKSAWLKQGSLNDVHNKAWWQNLVEEVVSPYSFDDKQVFFEDLYETFSDPSVWRIFPDVIETLNTLRMKGFQLAVASNWDDRLPLLLQKLELSKYFQYQFVSFQLKKTKAHEDFFLEVLSSLKLAPSEVIHVGDEEGNDYLAPQKIGIQSWLVNRKALYPKKYELTRLNELVEKVDNHFHN
jgi:putative hydrolase of the HAD superfamily